ncbi:YidC/Oxa1 family membrane protein insertase [Chryseolinea serpens]|uniref:Membrane protein insertase YidC n=1 Tax=Chryseolinea serpens TaxID=947013 RepID=A0A1M5KC51_9BACT|nr:membrane protein insertase YidC [Chryseolinea serpens]SHG50494.1 YidC/Oxa1 family membrane protein insertase [Chryseolinea serpens]
MDRNSAIGITLIAALLLVYFYWFSPTPKPVAQNVEPTVRTEAKADTVRRVEALPDSVLAATYGDLSTAMKGEETTTLLENEDLKITFSNKGGLIREVELKKFKTYSQQALKLMTPDASTFKLKTIYQGKDLDLYGLYYTLSQRKNADSTEVVYTVALANGAKIEQVYSIPAQGYEIGYKLRTEGLGEQLAGENLLLQWKSTVRPIEKDLTDTRINTTITYYADDSYNELKPRSKDKESEAIAKPLKWVAVKEKFFLSSIIAKTAFVGGNVETSIDNGDSSVVKYANIDLQIPKSQLTAGKADFKFYFGPNDYKKIGNVTEGFRKNVYLGWPPVYWINKFVIFPVFHFLTGIISNYGLIIIILVLLLKLVLFPLSYKSYLSMAKMKVLKPELDEIKERVGDDMTKVQQEQMKLYSQVGVNPISGCIPVLLQMPLIFAMFYLFPASIELRQQPLLWAEDLSTYDSLIHLPFVVPFLGNHLSLFTLLMTASTLIYTWQNNQISSVQGPMKSMSYIMPLVFLFVLNSFSAGLTFYYFISNLVTFAQQAIIKRFVDEGKIRAIMEENKKKNATGGGKKSKFMSKLEEAMKSSEEARRKAEEERRNKKK